jgi:hypothetical protein
VRELSTEELGQTLHFELVDGVNAEPGRTRGDDEGCFRVVLLDLGLKLLILVGFGLGIIVDSNSF